MTQVYFSTINYQRLLFKLHGLFLTFSIILGGLLGLSFYSLPREAILANYEKIQDLFFEFIFINIFTFIGLVLIARYFIIDYFEVESPNIDKLISIGQDLPNLKRLLRKKLFKQELLLLIVDLFFYFLLSPSVNPPTSIIFINLFLKLKLGYRILYSGCIFMVTQKIFQDLIEKAEKESESVTHELDSLMMLEKEKKGRSVLISLISLIFYAIILVIHLNLNSDNRNWWSVPRLLTLLTLLIYPLIIAPITYPGIIIAAKGIRSSVIQKMKLFHTIKGKIYLKISEKNLKSFYMSISLFWLIVGSWSINSLYSFQSTLHEEKINLKYGSFDYRFTSPKHDLMWSGFQNYATQIMNNNSNQSESFHFSKTHLGEQVQNSSRHRSFSGVLLDVNESNYFNSIDPSDCEFTSDIQNRQKEEIFEKLYNETDQIIVSQAFANSKGVNLGDQVTLLNPHNYQTINFSIVGVIKYSPLLCIDSPVDGMNFHFIISNLNRNISDFNTPTIFYFCKSQTLLHTSEIKEDLEEIYQNEGENLYMEIESKNEEQNLSVNSFLGKYLYFQQVPLFVFLIFFVGFILRKATLEFEKLCSPIIITFGGLISSFKREFKWDLIISLFIQLFFFYLIALLNYFFLQYILNHLVYDIIELEYFAGFSDILDILAVSGWELQYYGSPLPIIYHVDFISLFVPVILILLVSGYFLIEKNTFFKTTIKTKKK
ncbi:MAG: hypothetical protein ACTSRK_03875 [Promethearchaeota archaeon]